jgi:SAM-dependent methyltransferase
MSFESEREYWESRLRRHSGLEGVGYMGLGRAFNAWMYRARRTLVLRRLRPLVAGREELNVLDIGSGSGFYIDSWLELGATTITGSDITESAVGELASRYPGVEFVRFDVGGANEALAGRSFDVVSAFDVLFHITDDRRYRSAFVNMARLLTPGGVLVFTDNFLHGTPVRSPTQVSRALTEIERTVQEAGFEILERRPALVLMNAPIDSDGLLLRAWWRALCRVVGASEALGWILGALLYPAEILLGSILRESPTTEIMVCRKASEPT